jgi:tripartite-type tricarboxylate transporter receptor subunit TctC
MIDYPEDCRDRLSKEFNKIIEDNGWAEDIRLAREALARSGKDAQELVEMAERENISIFTAMQNARNRN